MAPMSKKALAPSVTVRDAKGLKFISIVEAAYNKAGLSEEEAQRVNEASGLANLVGNFIAENRRQGQFTYPKEYRRFSIQDQIYGIEKLFGLDSTNARSFIKHLPELPEGAEGWFAIPRWEKIAPTYNVAVEKVFATISSKRKFYNYREGQLGPEHLRQHVKTAEMFQKVGNEQSGDILVVACQFGLRHCSKSVRRAREVFIENEFGLDAFSVGIMLLTHPERLQHYDDLWIDCAGDEFSPVADGGFSLAPYFVFSDGRVRFDTHWVFVASDFYGSASGFLP